MPVSASKSLREFLEANGIPVRELEEYASIPHTEPSVYELKAEVQ
jgi:uroporphyrinogen-III synthase